MSVEEQIIELLERVRPAAVAEARKYLAEALYGIAQDVEDHGLEALSPEACGQPVPTSTFDVGSFVEGMQFAARLIADQEFDY